MTKRRKSLPIEDETVYEGEVIIPSEENPVVRKRDTENNHELNMRKLDVATDFVQVAKQIVNIIAIREDSNNKINEMDAEIRRLKQVTEREIQLLQENRKEIVSRGDVVAKILSEMTPLLANDKLSTEARQQIIDVFERSINTAVNKHEQN